MIKFSRADQKNGNRPRSASFLVRAAFWPLCKISPFIGLLAWSGGLLVLVDTVVWRLPFVVADQNLRHATLIFGGVSTLGVSMLLLWPYFCRRILSSVPLTVRAILAGLASSLALFICFRGGLPQRTFATPLEIRFRSVPNADSLRQTFYIIGIADNEGRMLITASNLYAHAVSKTSCALANKGHGIWSDLPSMGNVFSLEWKGTIRMAPGTSLRLQGGSGKTLSVLDVDVNGQTSRIRIDDDRESPVYAITIVRRLAVTHYRVLRGALAMVIAFPLWMLFIWVRASELASSTMSEGVASGHRSLKRLKHRVLFACLIILGVFLFNMHVPFADLLWHDDPMWFFDAPTIVSKGISHIRWYGTLSILPVYRAYLYSYGMYYWGVPATRLLFVFILSVASVLSFFVYSRVLRLNMRISIVAALLPNILPQVIGIPIGLNSTYAVFSLIPALVSALLIPEAIVRRGVWAFICGVSAVAAFWVALGFSGSGVFLGPCLLALCGCLFLNPIYRAKAVLWAIPLTALTAQKAFLQATQGSKRPVDLPLDTVLSRVLEFFQISALTASPSRAAVAVTIGLVIVGLVIVIVAPSRLTVGTNIADKGNMVMRRVLLFGWPVCWMASNSYAYVAKSADFRSYDYAYVFAYGSVLLQVICLSALISVLTWPLRHLRIRNAVSILLLTTAVLMVGAQRMLHGRSVYAPYEALSKTLRSELSQRHLPKDAQVLVETDSSYINHSGNYIVNSGLLQFILNRNDVRALIGPSVYPNDPFRKTNGWFDTMSNFSPEKPLFAFKIIGDRLVPTHKLLRVYATNSLEHSRIAWTLYETRFPLGMLKPIADGTSLRAIQTYLDTSEPTLLPESRVAFFDPDDLSDLLTEAAATALLRKASLLTQPIGFGDVAMLEHASLITWKTETRMELVVRVLRKNSHSLQVGFQLSEANGYQRLIPLWRFAEPGDAIVLTSGPLTQASTQSGVRFQLWNMGVWPFKPLAPEIILRLPASAQSSDSSSAIP